MYDPGYAPVRSPRHQPLTLDVVIPGLDVTASSMSFQFRMNPEADPALISIEKGAAGGDTITAELIEYDGIPATQIMVSVSRATIEGLPVAKPIGSDLEGVYGFKLDGSELFGGPLTLGAQANHA